MSSTPEIGTLIVVVLKANHLPNKRHIGKQDPYCVVSVNGEKRRTKAIKRGGQHPEWDEEIRFTLFEDVGDVPEKTVPGNGTPPPPPPKDSKGPKNIKGGKRMKLSCFADDTREPDFIGETDVDLTEVLTKGETDEWFTLMNKDKFAGKVYLELTFWSNEPPPEKKVTPKPARSTQYGGPGSFIPTAELPPSANGYSHPSRVVSTTSLYNHSRHSSDHIPSSLRASSSLAKLDLYVPPYEQMHRISTASVDYITNEFGEFSVSDSQHRRESFPPLHNDGYTLRSSSPPGYTTVSSHSSRGFDHSLSDVTSTYSTDRPNGQNSTHQRSSLAGSHYPVQSAYHPQYETGPPPSRGPRHSVPASSSGFMPMPQPSGFAPLASQPFDPTFLPSSLSHTPAPLGYNASQFNPQVPYQQVPSQTPVPTNGDGYPTPASFHSQPSFPFPHYASAAPSALPHGYGVPPTPTPGAPSQAYQGFAPTHSPSHDSTTAPPSNYSSSSRPLPQEPQVVYGHQQVHPSYSLPPSGSSPHQMDSYSPTQPGDVMFAGSGVYIPPPPPPPLLQPQLSAGTPAQQQYTTTPGPPPPPPPPQVIPQISSRPRRSSLPVPPVNYQQQSQLYQQPPPPPPPLPEHLAHSQPPLPPLPPPSHFSNSNTLYQPGPPPKPPALPDGQGQWLPPQPVDSGYPHQTYN